MAKRFTDTEKWQPWFRKLPVECKAFWIFLCDQCDAAGVWERDDEIAQIYVYKDLDLDKALDAINKEKLRIKVFAESLKWQLIDFIPFQYRNIRKDNKVHTPVYVALKKHGIDAFAFEMNDKDYPETLQSLKDKTRQDMDKDKTRKGRVDAAQEFVESVNGQERFSAPPPPDFLKLAGRK